MPDYTCLTCGKVFTQIGHYNIHKERKRACKKVEIVLEPDVGTIVEPIDTLPINQTIKPLIKYVGGKTQILKEVFERFPKVIANYYEPFVGGGSVLFAFLENNPTFAGTIVAADLNERLIWFYKNVQSSVNLVLAELKIIVDAYNAIKIVKGEDININPKKPENAAESLGSQEAYYYWMRIRYNTLENVEAEGPLGAALFLFLNKTCFRGIHRCGPHGFNVPFGNYKNPAIYDEEHMKAVSALLSKVTFRCCDFTACVADAKKGDFVYMDPPYVPEEEKSFVGYNMDGFGENDHERFFVCCEKLVEKNVQWLMSNSDMALVKNRFPPEKNFVTGIVSCRRSVNAKEPGSRTNEVLIQFLLQD